MELDDQNLYNFTTEKDFFHVPSPPWRMSKLQERPSALKREHPSLQNMKFLHFFFFLWVIFAPLDPTKIYADPDPQHYAAQV